MTHKNDIFNFNWIIFTASSWSEGPILDLDGCGFKAFQVKSYNKIQCAQLVVRIQILKNSVKFDFKNLLHIFLLIPMHL